MRLNNGDVVTTENAPCTYNKSDDVEAKFKCSEKIADSGISFGSSPIDTFYSFKISTRGQ
jgi:hypothetical protein